MLKILGLIISIILIGLIFLSIPQESLGLKSVGSQKSVQRVLNFFIIGGILIYLGIAIKLNF